MKENWEINWKDYYQILQVHPLAEAEIITAAYRKLADKYHPDHNPGNEQWANDKFKQINNAYEIIGNNEKRKLYHSAYLQRTGFNSSNSAFPPYSQQIKPKPEVNPTIIRFEGVIPGEVRRDTFIVKNSGGPYSKVWISNPNSWINIMRQKPLSDTGKLPLLVEIEAKGNEWGKTYIGNIIVKIDDVETNIRVELTTSPKTEQPNKEEWDGRDNSEGKSGVNFNGTFYERYRLGKSLMDNETQTPFKTCKGCGVKNGEYHKPGCIYEICPICHVWLTTCDHKTLFPSTNQASDYSREQKYETKQTEEYRKKTTRKSVAPRVGWI